MDDRSISEYAEQHGWIVFTEDDDFHEFDHNRGVVFYTHTERPSPGEIVDALGMIEAAYDDHRQITEHVPDGWI